MSTPAAQPADSLAARLRNVRVRLRNDLHVTRHRFRGESHYVVRDPLTFQSHRFDAGDYAILLNIRGDQKLGDTFAALCASGDATAEQEEDFYSFIFSLHRYGFLNLPIADDKLLFKRYTLRQTARRKQKVTSILFMQVPLFNPNTFLDRTIRHVKPMFTRGAFFAWLLLMLTAAIVAFTSSKSLLQPLESILATRNLLIMWVTLILLKVFHEFGHAYACKAFGGHVPEMGAFFIVGTPCAYVDATACWGLPRKLERIIVCLAGMYFESIVAALAVFVWAFTEPGLIHSAAYNVMFLASVVTVGFNINPLMRYDGYYVAADLMEVPNLRQRATVQLQHWLKRIFLNIRDGVTPARGRMLGILVTFGAAASAYRVLIMVGIAAMLATRFRTVGLFIGALLLTMMLVGMTRKLTSYLWHAEETAPVRGRAIALSIALLIAMPVTLLGVPMKNNITTDGVMRREREWTVRAQVPGFLETTGAPVGTHAPAETPLASLHNESLQEALLEAQANVNAAEFRYNEMLASDPAGAHEARAELQKTNEELRRREEMVAALAIATQQAGDIVENLATHEAGRFINTGTPIARLADGDWLVHAMIPATELAMPGLEAGTQIEFCAANDTRQRLRGTVDQIKPVGVEAIEFEALTHAGGGDIVVGPEGTTDRPFVEVIVRLQDADQAEWLYHGLTGRMQIECKPEPLGIHVLRKVLRFTNRLTQA